MTLSTSNYGTNCRFIRRQGIFITNTNPIYCRYLCEKVVPGNRVTVVGVYAIKKVAKPGGAVRRFVDTVEPVIYDHPLVPVILFANDRWS